MNKNGQANRTRLFAFLACLCFLSGFVLILPAAGETAEELVFEAESGILNGNAAVRSADGVSWVEGFQNQETDSVTIPVSVPAEGFYDLTTVLASQGGHKENPVELDGQQVGLILADEKSFTESTLEHLWFSAGEHTIRIRTGWGYIRVDAVRLTPSAPLPADLYEIPEDMAVGEATPEARRLYDWLRECYGKKIISGQFCDGGMYGLENQAIWRATKGSYPAILGLDMMDYSTSRVEKGGANDQAVPYAIEYWENGGIVTFCWHWNAPSPYLKDPWYSGFYTQYTSFDLAKAMNGEDPEGYDLLMKDIDAVAFQLTRLKDAGVPVLWRPLHEASGGWFWWGASGKDAYLKLYHLLFDRLTREYGLNNLIWVWNGQDAEWYPGDEEVDLIGIDIYPGERVYDPQGAAFLQMMKVTDARKMIILSENGCIPDPELVFRNGTVWGSWCTWGGEFVVKSSKFNKPSEQYTESEKVKQFYADERVVKRADIPDLRGAE